MNNTELTIKITFTDKDTVANSIRDNGMLFSVLSQALDISRSQIQEAANPITKTEVGIYDN